MANWTKVGMDMGVGVVFGAGDQFVSNMDAKRDSDFMAANAGKHLSMLKKIGTYVSFGIPIAAVGAVAFNALRGDWATRVLTASGSLLGRGGVAKITDKNYRNLYSAAPYQYHPVRNIVYTPDSNPQNIQSSPNIPTVQPQGNFGGRGDLG